VKAYLLFTSGGPLTVLTSCDSVDHPEFLEQARAKGYDKFVAYELPLEAVKARYGMHFEAVCSEPHSRDALRVLDFEGKRIYKNFSFEELGTPGYFESPESQEYVWSSKDSEALPVG
jgi:hypothetical protein